MSDWDAGDPADNFDLAIVGMAGRFPGAADLAAFWRNLRDGVESITFFTDAELAARGVRPAALSNPRFVKAAPVLDEIDRFDAAFFGYSPREAEIIDPQHRIFLECAWAALEDAGCNPEAYDGLIGVYAGTSLSTYLLFNLLSRPEFRDSEDTFQAMIGNDKDFLSTRVSYELNLKGPSVDVQTGCSTSLVAVHLACQALLNYHCDLALAGGVSVNVPQRAGYYYQEGGITSPDGHCRAFDAEGQGTLFGSGAGVVALKRFVDARADGDRILALIKGSAVNNDGAQKIGFTAPGVEGQAEVIARAQAVAGVEPDTISYVEAHGTATALGDTAEVAALTSAFRAGTQRNGFCAIGSVKTNIGHLDAAAGVAGLIKTVLALQHQQIPPSLHFRTPNPKIDFAGSPFYVNAILADWPAGPTPRRAGISSFGIGGTNAHVIIEEPPPPGPAEPARAWQILPISARSAPALDAATASLAAHLRAHPDASLADAAHTLQVGRKAFEHRRAVVARDATEAAHALETGDPLRVFTAARAALRRTVVFMFPGGGAQYAGMGRELYGSEPVFRDAVDRCAEILRPILGRDIRAVLYSAEDEGSPDEGRRTKDEGSPDEGSESDEGRPVQNEGSAIGDRPLSSLVVRPSSNAGALTRTDLALPALFAVEYALAQLWMSWGVRPDAMIGHSLGEYAAACLAGVLSLEDALALVALRGRLFTQIPAGAMLSVALAEDQLGALLGEDLSVAAINAPGQCVVSGPSEAIERLAATLAEREVEFRRVQIDVAAHSRMVEPILAEFTAFVRTLRLRPPEIAYISNVSGTWIRADEATDPVYWARHLRRTVRFADGVRELLRDADRALLEVGPGRTLCTLAKRQIADPRAQPALPSIRHPYDRESDQAFLLATLGKLWIAGVAVDWAGFAAHERRRRVGLPTYPFERRSYWIAPAAEDAPRAEGKKPDLADWFYIPSWKRSMPPDRAQADAPQRWLIFCDPGGIAEDLARRLRRDGHDVTCARVGERFARIDDDYALDPRRRDEYGALIDELRGQDRAPRRIVHAWSVGAPAPDGPIGARVADAQDLGFYSLLYLAQALGEREQTEPLQIIALVSHVQQVESADATQPERATILGPCRVIPQEYEQIGCRIVDVVPHALGTPQREQILRQLEAEIAADSDDFAVAYRGMHRWVQTYEPERLAAPGGPGALREGGVYLITGGLGGVGLAFAEHLARAARARLALVGRTALPARGEWEGWLAAHDAIDAISQKIRAVGAIEAMGSEVLALSADVADAAQLRAAVAQAEARFGPINGVIHAAGDPGGGVIQLKTREMCERVFAPKLAGALALDALMGDARLDFMLLCSSVNAILAEVGQVDYCAANAFLGAFAQHRAAATGAPIVAVDWNRWQGLGMAVAVEAMHEQITGTELAGGMAPHEGLEALDRILSGSRLPQIVVSTQDLPAQIAQHRAFKLSRSLDDLAAARMARSAHPRPALETDYVVPQSPTEATIAAIWQDLLGIEQLGIYDNFFDLGGNSLIGLKVIARLKQALGVEVTVVNLFEGPTVSALAALIERERSGPPSYDESFGRGERRREKRLRKLRAVKEDGVAG